MPTERDDDLEATQAQVSYDAGLRDDDETAGVVDRSVLGEIRSRAAQAEGPPLVSRTGGTFTVTPPRTEVGAIRWTGGNLAEVTAWLRDRGNELVDVDRDADTVHRLAWRRWTAPSGAPCSRVRVGGWIVEDRVHPTWLHALDDVAFRAGYAAVPDPVQETAPVPPPPLSSSFIGEDGAALLERCGDDAAVWASEFMRVHRVLAGRVGWLDEGTMIGWFANAIERACEVRERRRRAAAARGSALALGSQRTIASDVVEMCGDRAGEWASEFLKSFPLRDELLHQSAWVTAWFDAAIETAARVRAERQQSGHADGMSAGDEARTRHQLQRPAHLLKMFENACACRPLDTARTEHVNDCETDVCDDVRTVIHRVVDAGFTNFVSLRAATEDEVDAALSRLAEFKSGPKRTETSSVAWPDDGGFLVFDDVLSWLRDRPSVVSCEAVVGPDRKVSHVAVRYRDSRGMTCFFAVHPGDTLHTPDGVRIVVQRADGATYAPSTELQQLGPTSSDPTEDEVRAEPMLQLFRHSHLREGELRDTSYAFCTLALQLARLPRNPQRTVMFHKLREAKDCAVTALLWKTPITKSEAGEGGSGG